MPTVVPTTATSTTAAPAGPTTLTIVVAGDLLAHTSVIEMARWGGAAMSEVDRVGKRLKDKVGDNAAWGEEWEKEAQRIEKMAEDALAHKHVLSAAGHYLRAATYYFTADRFVAPGPHKTGLYQSCLRCFRAGL